jgi:hypothetical protein
MSVTSAARVAIPEPEHAKRATHLASPPGWSDWELLDLKGGALTCTSVQSLHEEPVADRSAASPRVPAVSETQHPSKTVSIST